MIAIATTMRPGCRAGRAWVRESGLPGKLRSGMTLVELIIAIAIIVMLAGMVVAFWPGMQDQQRAAQGAELFDSWLRQAKARAFAIQKISGLRLFIDPTTLQVTQCQYLDQPDDFFIWQSSISNLTGTTVTFTNGFNPTTAAPVTLDFFNGAGTSPTGAALWEVQPGDYLEVNGAGQVHYITAVSSTNGATGNQLSLQPTIYGTVIAVAGNQITLLNATSTLSAALNNSAASLTVANAAAFPTPGTFMILIDAEIMLVTAVSGSTFTVTRGANGTVAASHALNAPVTTLIGNLSLGCYLDNLAGTATVMVQSLATSGSNIIATVTPIVGTLSAGTLVQSHGINSSGAGSSFRVIRAPRVAGDEQLQMPNNIVIDLSLNQNLNNAFANLPSGPSYAQNGNPLPLGPSPTTFDILFAPSGTLLTPGVSTDFMACWVAMSTATIPSSLARPSSPCGSAPA